MLNPHDLYVIWSMEHDAWWCPDRRGYTLELELAGVYRYDEAADIVAHANLVACHECMIPVTSLSIPQKSQVFSRS